MNFTGPTCKFFQVLIYIEFWLLILTLLVIFVALYIVFKHPQFHWNVIGIFGNLTIVYIVLILCRLMQMFAIGFDPNKDAIDWQPHDFPFEYYLDTCRVTAENCYVLMIISIAVERTMATIMLKSYESFNNPSFLLVTIPAQWCFGFIIQYSITNRMWDGITWGIIFLGILISSFGWLVLLHYINQYRYDNRVVNAYNLRERFQLSENVRFLKMVKWSVATMLIFDIIFIGVLIWTSTDPKYDHSQFTTYNFTIVFNAMILPLVSILTNRTWKAELIKIIRTIRMCRRNVVADSDENHRFHAPYIRTLTGNPMVFNAEQERNLYYSNLNNQWNM